MKRVFAIFVLSACAFVLVMILRKDDVPRRVGASVSVMEDVKVVSRENGNPRWSLSSEKAFIAEDGETASLERVTVFIPAQGMTVTADAGTYEMAGRRLGLEGNITASADDYTINTGRAEVRSPGGEIRAEGPVAIRGKKLNIEGKGLFTRGEEIRILEDVRAEFY